MIFLRFIRILRSQVSKQKFYWTELNKQGRLFQNYRNRGERLNSTPLEQKAEFLSTGVSK